MDTNLIPKLLNPETAELAKQANAMLLDALTRPFPYGWDGVERRWAAWLESQQRDLRDDMGMMREADKWFGVRFEKGEESENSIRILRSLIPLLAAAEQIDAPWLYVSTITSIFPIVHTVEEFLHHTAYSLLPEKEHERTGTWAEQFGMAATYAEKVYMDLTGDKPITWVE